MSNFNNFSVLPWYGGYQGKEFQDFRKWWKYGHIYPLYGSTSWLIPSQIVRTTHETSPNIAGACSAYEYEDGMVLDENGLDIASGVTGTGELNYDISEIGLVPIIITFSEGYNGGKGWSLFDTNDSVLISGSGSAYLDLPNIYPTAARLSVVIVNNVQPKNPVYYAADGGAIQTALPIGMELYKPDGTLVKSMSPAGLWEAKTVDGKDYLLSVSAYFDSDIPEGQYYFKIWDNLRSYYSDVFTAIGNLKDFIYVTWYDNEDFVMDAGRIIYVRPDLSLFTNQVILRADIAKPKYEFEEEGETRDGIFYPIKQISKKVYQMHILANEPLLDVMRFIRMSEHVRITYYLPNGNITNLDAQTFLISPEWEAEGDVAGVTIEFETDTVAKKVGLAYIR